MLPTPSSEQSHLGDCKPLSFLEFLVDAPIYRENHPLKGKGVVLLWLFSCFMMQIPNFYNILQNLKANRTQVPARIRLPLLP